MPPTKPPSNDAPNCTPGPAPASLTEPPVSPAPAAEETWLARFWVRNSPIFRAASPPYFAALPIAPNPPTPAIIRAPSCATLSVGVSGFGKPSQSAAPVIVCDAFYENVSRHKVEDRELAEGEAEENVVLEFRPQPRQDMLIACLYSHWQQDGEELWSFAAITDEPPPEVAAAGHDRCIIPIKEEHLDAWISPDPKKIAALYAILDDRQRPYYEHRMAA